MRSTSLDAQKAGYIADLLNTALSAEANIPEM
jgi:hypothetical protein